MKVWIGVFGLLMLSAAGLSVMLTPRQNLVEQHQINLETMFPTQFGDWRLDQADQLIVPTVDVREARTEIYDQLLQRTYINSRRERIMFVVGYGSKQTGNFKAHPQDVCYRAQGSELKMLSRGELPLENHAIPVTRMFAVKPGRSEPVTFWFTVGTYAVNTPYAWLLAQLRYGLSGAVPDGLLIRVSNLSSDSTTSYRLHETFVKDLAHAMRTSERWRLTGV